ncbi:DNA-directed DNA polymerase [Senna tora]|uniref:DNA-directed DNA polymerase n=1 Tax=Senna tora TaxID=362788 RepID=A0A834SXF8_9FABA|nr:DNA-directed DNA polymerase [Senna tora]
MAEEKTLKELDAPPKQQAPLGLENEDPYNRLKEFHVVFSSMKPDRITEEQIKLRAFPFSLEDATKKVVVLFASRFYHELGTK